jgi:tRNA1Val (adenine37-N6)-methyltransferase
MIFQFKQFNIKQSQSAMKVGTDGVLLGAWTSVTHQPQSILDIGAGTGLLALMLAQRTSAEMIDAIEIEEGAYEECVENFENSPWNDRLFCFHAGLDEFVEEPEVLYDLIVCNPPFYEEHYKSEKPQRDLARFQDAMPFNELLEAADFLLSEEGVFSVIIPFYEEEKFMLLAAESSLFPFKVTRVKGHESAAIKRSLMAFGRKKTIDIQTDELIIENGRHQYTAAYQALTKDFYIKM